MIENDEDLKKAAAEAGGLLQSISDYIGKNPDAEKHGRVNFPRGFLRTNVEARRRLKFVQNDILRANISYALMTHDVFRWVATRTDLSGQANEMVIKEGLCVMASVCECLTIHPNEYGLGRNQSFAARVKRLFGQKIIDEKTRDNLIWLWDKRRQEHLYDVKFKEYSHYKISDWNRAIRAFKGLRTGLEKWLLPDE